MITASRWRNRQFLTVMALLGLLSGCGPSRVDVQGKFPPPLIEPLPLTMGVWYGEDFSKHEFSEEAKTRRESSWIVNTGAAQVQMWDTLLAGMFIKLVHLDHKPEQGLPIPGVDGVLIPHVEELQYAIPIQTQVKVFEVWMRYRFEVWNNRGQTIAEWPMSSYGKTPTALLQSDQEAVNLAAVMALRDAGANFATHFTRVPELQEWLHAHGVQGGAEKQ